MYTCPSYDMSCPYLDKETGICTLDDAQYECDDMASAWDWDDDEWEED